MSPGKIYKSLTQTPEEKAKNPRIIIIDDDPEFLKLIGHYLSKHGHNLDVFEDARAGIRHLEDNDYDVLLLDIGMPELDGFEVSKQLHDKIPIVMVSTGRDAKKLAELKDHYDAYVDKKNIFVHLLPTIQIGIRQWHLKHKKPPNHPLV